MLLLLMLHCWKVRVCTGSSSRAVQPGVNGADLLLEGLKMMLMLISMLMLLCKGCSSKDVDVETYVDVDVATETDLRDAI